MIAPDESFDLCHALCQLTRDTPPLLAVDCDEAAAAPRLVTLAVHAGLTEG